MNEGEIIRFIRKEKKISQEKLARGICTVKHLSNVELGRSTMSYNMVCLIIERLNTDSSLVINKDIKRYGLKLYKEMKAVELLFLNLDFSMLNVKVDQLLSDYSLGDNNRKKLQYYKAVCISEIDGAYDEANNILYSSLCINNYIEVIKLLKSYCDILELDMINAIAVNLDGLNKKKSSHDLFEGILKHLTKYEKLESTFGIKIMFNKMKLLYSMKLYEELIILGDLGIETCKRKKYNHYSGICFYMGRAYKKLGNRSLSKHYFKRYVYLELLFETNLDTLGIVNSLIEEENLTIDKSILDMEV